MTSNKMILHAILILWILLINEEMHLNNINSEKLYKLKPFELNI